MEQNEERSEPNWKDRIAVKYTKVKNHVRKNKTTYAVGAAGVVLTTVTFVVTKRVYNLNGMLARKIVIKDSVLLIRTYERHQGPPSWIVRSGDQLWRSQIAAAKANGVSKSTMSQHLNGHRPHINGRVFERVAIEVGRSG